MFGSTQGMSLGGAAFEGLMGSAEQMTTTTIPFRAKFLRTSNPRGNRSPGNELGQESAAANYEKSAEMRGFGVRTAGYNAGKMAEKLNGVVERVTFHNLDNGFAVLRVTPDGRRDPVTVVGTLPSVVAGETIEADGKWQNTRDHGMQFKAETIRTAQPGTIDGITRYLGSGLVKGIGGHFAKKIVDTFGERTLEVIDESPQFLAEIKGIGPKRIDLIRKSWQEQKGIRNILIFLQSCGIGANRAVRIYKTYGDRAVEIVKQNPYRLATDIWGIGFQTADQIALKMGMDRNSPLRAQAAVLYVLQEFSGDGHVGYPEEGVVQAAINATQIHRDIIVAAVEAARSSGEIVRDSPIGDLGFAIGDLKNSEQQSHITNHKSQGENQPWLFLKPLFLAELGVARQVRALREDAHPLPKIDVEAALGWVEKRMKLTLAETQRAAIRAAATEKVMVITGGPGTGKSTIVRGILDIFTAKGMRIAVAAPTGRAAKRLCEVTGRDARTIHRLLEYDPGLGRFRRDRETPLEMDLLVVDEASMVDIVLMNQLLRAVPPHACLVLVGDVDQLPSVGPGSVLGDLIESGVIPVVRLTEIFRQAEQSWIVRAAHAVNHGEMPESSPKPDGDFFFIEANEPEAILERVIAMVRERIPQRFKIDPLRDVQVLSPMNRTELGVTNLNEKMQKTLNPPDAAKKEVQRFGVSFRTGDKVMQMKNNYTKEVYNGDIGKIVSVDLAEQMLTINYDGREVPYEFNELDELQLAYATTIHKSQGNEYPAVIIPMHTQHYVMLQRNLLYTGITRGKKLVALVGSRKALALAVQRQDTSRRNSLLRQRLQQERGEESPCD
jgi:exodeoxyribonuclease V alpha subunit